MVPSPRRMIRSPLSSRLSILLPRADPSGQVCALSRTLPFGEPGLIPGGRSQAVCSLPVAAVGGTSGTLRLSRGRASTLPLRMIPGTVMRVGLNGSEVGFAHGDVDVGLGLAVGVGVAVGVGRAATSVFAGGRSSQ